MKLNTWLLGAVLVGVLSAGCGEMTGAMSPSVTNPAGCAIQTFGSTVVIFDVTPSC